MAYATRMTRTVRTSAGAKRKVRTEKFYAFYKDAVSGLWRHKVGYLDEAATLALAVRLEIESARRREGLYVPDDKPSKLVDLLERFTGAMRARSVTEKYIAATGQRLRSVFAGCRWTFLRDLNADRALEYLATQRLLSKDGKREAPKHARARFGLASSNHYVTALRMFGRWLASKRLVSTDPFAGAEKMRAESDRRHERRALSQLEFERLLTITTASKWKFRGVDGATRSSIYLAAGMTGLRAGELFRLTPGDVDLGAKTFKLPGSSDKARRGAVLPLHAALLTVLEPLCASTALGKPLWPGTWIEKPAKMLKHDLREAGIDYKLAAGAFDFHALRGQFVTSLARAGVSLVVAQKLARHSTPTLTANVYSKLGDADLAAGIDALPNPRVHRRVHGKKPK